MTRDEEMRQQLVRLLGEPMPRRGWTVPWTWRPPQAPTPQEPAIDVTTTKEE